MLVACLQLQENVAAAAEDCRSVKESTVEYSTDHTIDLSAEEAPSVPPLDQMLNDTPVKGKRRMTTASKTRNEIKNQKQQSNATASDHKMLKVIKQEK